ncbi:MAG: hypothetical protein ACM3XM_11195 [Mycobacterium leprae]
MAADLLFIVPPSLADGAGEGQPITCATPYGTVNGFITVGGLHLLPRPLWSDARAMVYAAKDLGYEWLLAVDAVEPVSRLLEPGDLVVPGDVIDQTHLRPFTFFAGKGYGFIPTNPACCPDLSAASFAACRTLTPRSFRGATYLCTDGPRRPTPAEKRMYRQWGVDVVGNGLLPEAFLARELELHYAALTVVGQVGLLPVLHTIAGFARGEQPCTCGESMKGLKEQRIVGTDWRTW